MSSAKLGFCRFGWPWWVYLAQHTIPIPRTVSRRYPNRKIQIFTYLHFFRPKHWQVFTRKQVVVFFATGWRKRAPRSHDHVTCRRLLANDRKVTRWAKTACVSCSGKVKAGTKWLRYFAVLRKVDPIDNHTLELKITVKGCERYPKRVVQKHLAQWDAKVDMGNIQWCTCLIYPRLVFFGEFRPRLLQDFFHCIFHGPCHWGAKHSQTCTCGYIYL